MKKTIWKHLRLLSTGCLMATGMAVSLYAQTPVVSTFAGSGNSGPHQDGQGTLANFYTPSGLDVDESTGNLFVADEYAHVIRKITPGGYVSTFAGNPAFEGGDDIGTGIEATFYDPVDLCIQENPDPWSNISFMYIADRSINLIRPATEGGYVDGGLGITLDRNCQGVCVFNDFLYISASPYNTITRIKISDGTKAIYGPVYNPHDFFLSGHVDASWTNARFNDPRNLCADEAGNIYVADRGNNAIRKLSPTGQVTTLASVPGPQGICRDGAGNFYVTSSTHHAIYKINASGSSVTVFAGAAGTSGYADGTAANARFGSPWGIWVNPAGNVFYVSDRGNHRIRKITFPVITTSGSLTAFTACPGKPSPAQSVTVKGDFLAASLAVTAPGGFEISTSPSGSFAHTLNLSPSALAMENNVPWTTIYIRLAASAPPGTYNGSLSFSSTHASTRYVSVPASTVNATCPEIFTQAYHVNTVAGHWHGEEGADEGCPGYLSGARFMYPGGVFLTAGDLYVADTYDNKVRKVSADGRVSDFAGNGAIGNINAEAATSSFNQLQDLCMDAAGNIYVADGGNHAIRKISSSGTVTTLAGSVNGSSGYSDGTGTGALFNKPAGICLDPSETYLYVADKNNHKIRRITLSSGIVITFAGSSTNLSGSSNGTGTSARFNNPTDVCTDASGNVFVTDLGNRRIRRITSGGIVTHFAGTGATGYRDGTGTSNVQFSAALHALTLDEAGNLYVCDGDRIRKVSTSGMVTTLAGNGTFSLQNGAAVAAAAAEFRNPTGIAVNHDGSIIYVADTKNNIIRKIALDHTRGTYKFASCSGTASPVQPFVISGRDIIGGSITVTSSAGFEISRYPDSGFSSSVSLTALSGNVTPTTVYVRMPSSFSGTAGNTIVCSSPLAQDKIISVNRTQTYTPFFSFVITKNRNLYPGQVLSVKSNYPATYTWSPSNHLTTLTTSQSMMFSNTTPGTYNYTVTATGGAGCTHSNSISLTIKKQGSDFDHYIDAGYISQSTGNNNPYSNTQNNNAGNGFGNQHFIQPSEDIYYKFTLTQPSLVEISHCNTNNLGSYITDSYLTLYDAKRKKLEENDNLLYASGGCSAGGGNLATIRRNLMPGVYYVVSEGKGTASGNITTNITTLPMGAGQDGYDLSKAILISNNIGSCFYYTHTDHMGRGFADINGFGGAEVYYKMELNSTQTVMLSTCNAVLTDPTLYLLDEYGNPIEVQYDNGASYCGSTHAQKAVIQKTLSAGIYYVALEHAANSCLDYFTLEVSTTPGVTRANAINIGTEVGACFSYSDTRYMGCYKDFNESDIEEVYYKITIGPEPVTATISNCNSVISDPLLYLFDENFNRIYVSQQNGTFCPSGTIGGIDRDIFPEVILSANTTYFIVLERGDQNTNMGNATLDLQTSGPGCRMAAEVLPSTPLSYEESDLFHIYPNPTTGMVHVAYKGPETTGILIVSDMMGREIYRTAMNGAYQNIDLGQQPGGMYNVRIAGTLFSKLVHLQ